MKGKKDQQITSSPSMDAAIWSELPEEIQELILSFLPLKMFFSLRSTCKRFESLVFSPAFASKHASSPFHSFLLLSHPQLRRSFALFDHSLATWRDLSPLPLPRGPAPSSSSNGLLCFSRQNSSSFLVCNVLSKSSRAVPFPFRPFLFDSLSLVATPSGYSIFALSPSNRVFIYDSLTRSWTWPETNTLPGAVIGGDGCVHDKGALVHRRLYFSTPEPFSVVSFDMEAMRWERSGAELPRDINFVRLVSGDNGSKLFMVGGVGRSGISRSLRVWELRSESWVEMERVPDMMCQKFMSVCYHNYQHVYCFWHQGMVCVCCYTWPEILYYKVSRRTWHWLPKCPSLPEKWSCGFRWFSFVPNLYALV